jgi:hypothetical protein
MLTARFVAPRPRPRGQEGLRNYMLCDTRAGPPPSHQFIALVYRGGRRGPTRDADDGVRQRIPPKLTVIARTRLDLSCGSDSCVC